MKKVVAKNVQEFVQFESLVRDKIYSGELNSMRVIKDFVFTNFDALNSTFGSYWDCLESALSDYIIHCHVEKLIPETGY